MESLPNDPMNGMSVFEVADIQQGMHLFCVLCAHRCACCVKMSALAACAHERDSVCRCVCKSVHLIN